MSSLIKYISPCLFCLEPLIKEEISIIVPCGHVFHSSCMEMWKEKHGTKCIICKTRINAVYKVYGLFEEIKLNEEGLEDKKLEGIESNEIKEEMMILKKERSLFQVKANEREKELIEKNEKLRDLKQKMEELHDSLEYFKEMLKSKEQELHTIKKQLLKKDLYNQKICNELNNYKTKDYSDEYIKEMNLEKLIERIKSMKETDFNEKLYYVQHISLQKSRLEYSKSCELINKLNNTIDELKYELKEQKLINNIYKSNNSNNHSKMDENSKDKIYKENILDEIQNEYNNIIKPKKRKLSGNINNNTIINIDSDDNNDIIDNHNKPKDNENHLLSSSNNNNVKIKKKSSLIHYSGNITSDGSYIRKGFDGIGGITKLNSTRDSNLRFDKLLMNASEYNNKKALKNSNITSFFS